MHAWPGVKIMTERDAVTTTLCRHGRKLDVRFDTKNQVASFHPYEVSAELDVLLCNPVPMSRVCGIVSAFFRRVSTKRGKRGKFFFFFFFFFFFCLSRDGFALGGGVGHA